MTSISTGHLTAVLLLFFAVKGLANQDLGATNPSPHAVIENATPGPDQASDDKLEVDAATERSETADEQIERWKSWIEASTRPQALQDFNFRSFQSFMRNLKTLISLHVKYQQSLFFMWAKSDQSHYQHLLDGLYRDMTQLLPRLPKPSSEYEIASASRPYRGALKLQFEEMGVELMLLEMLKNKAEDPFYQRSIDRLLAVGEICRNEFKNWELGLLSRFLNEAIDRIIKADLHLIFGGRMMHTLIDMDPSLKQVQVDFLSAELAPERPKKPLKLAPPLESGLRAAYRLAKGARQAEVKPVAGALSLDMKPKIYKYNVATVSNLRAIGLVFQVLGQLGKHPFACKDLMADQERSDAADLWPESR